MQHNNFSSQSKLMDSRINFHSEKITAVLICIIDSEWSIYEEVLIGY